MRFVGQVNVSEADGSTRFLLYIPDYLTTES